MAGLEPRREPTQAQVGRRFASLAVRDTKPEIDLRRELHARGLRFRVDLAVSGLPRRRIDIAFTRRKVAVMVDGCFWHGCSAHLRLTGNNADWWAWKVAVNRARDDDTNRRLAALGWTVLRVWEHEPPKQAADRIEPVVRRH